MTLKSALLASVALCGLLAVPAMARSSAPNIHVVGFSRVEGATAHVKTKLHSNKLTDYTKTVTYSATLKAKAIKELYKTPTALIGETWLATSSGTCVQPTKQSWKGLPKKTLYAKITTGTTTGTDSAQCSGLLTYQDIVYDLVHKPTKGDTDSVKGSLIAPSFVGYHLDLVLTFDLNYQ